MPDDQHIRVDEALKDLSSIIYKHPRRFALWKNLPRMFIAARNYNLRWPQPNDVNGLAYMLTGGIMNALPQKPKPVYMYRTPIKEEKPFEGTNCIPSAPSNPVPIIQPKARPLRQDYNIGNQSSVEPPLKPHRLPPRLPLPGKNLSSIYDRRVRSSNQPESAHLTKHSLAGYEERPRMRAGYREPPGQYRIQDRRSPQARSRSRSRDRQRRIPQEEVAPIREPILRHYDSGRPRSRSPVRAPPRYRSPSPPRQKVIYDYGGQSPVKMKQEVRVKQEIIEEPKHPDFLPREAQIRSLSPRRDDFLPREANIRPHSPRRDQAEDREKPYPTTQRNYYPRDRDLQRSAPRSQPHSQPSVEQKDYFHVEFAPLRKPAPPKALMPPPIRPRARSPPRVRPRTRSPPRVRPRTRTLPATPITQPRRDGLKPGESFFRVEFDPIPRPHGRSPTVYRRLPETRRHCSPPPSPPSIPGRGLNHYRYRDRSRDKDPIAGSTRSPLGTRKRRHAGIDDVGGMRLIQVNNHVETAKKKTRAPRKRRRRRSKQRVASQENFVGDTRRRRRRRQRRSRTKEE